MNMNITVLDFPNFIRKASRVMTIATQRTESSESVRNKPAGVANVYPGTSMKLGDPQTINRRDGTSQ